MPEPLYTMAKCQPAFQLRWSLALFTWQPIPSSNEWLTPLRQATESDGVRILEHRVKVGSQLFLLSTRPEVSPLRIVQSVKGRLQHLIRASVPKAFRRNFRLTSVGDANLETVEAYLTRQLGHHGVTNDRDDQSLAEFQFQFPDVDLRLPQRSAHGEYLYNLHTVLVHAERWREVRRDRLQITSDMIVRCARVKSHRLSRLSLLGDHLHFTLGAPYESAPGEIVLGYMNNIAFAHGMVPLYPFSFYVGTIGEYDMNAVRSWPVAASTDARSEESGGRAEPCV